LDQGGAIEKQRKDADKLYARPTDYNATKENVTKLEEPPLHLMKCPL
jgi:hypothetical protein